MDRTGGAVTPMDAVESEAGGMLRATLKRAGEVVLARACTADVVRAFARSRPLVLAYHNIVPDDAASEGDRSLHLPRRRFVAQLERLLRTHEIVSLDELLTERRPTRPRVAITFDDAYRGAVAVGVPELVRLGVPATIFVAPEFVGGRSFWWDALGLPGGASIPEKVRAFALDALQGRDADIRARAPELGLVERPVAPFAAAATEEELRAAIRHTGITLASHSWSHPNLTRLDSQELTRELVTPLRWLRERYDRVVSWLAYPYGLSCPRVERAVAEAGYVGALCVSGGAISRRRAQRYSLPRLNVPAGLSAEGLALRTAGLFPLR